VKIFIITSHEESKLKQYACKLCHKEFGNQQALDSYEFTHLVEKPFKSDLFPKSYIKITGLIHHRRQHTGERPYKYNLCSWKYAQKNSSLCSVEKPWAESEYMGTWIEFGELSWNVKLTTHQWTINDLCSPSQLLMSKSITDNNCFQVRSF